ncbi:MAG: TonB family protein [Rickettsiales bacterium]|nr:TonB family protein [Rickettsiales bacterium]
MLKINFFNYSSSHFVPLLSAAFIHGAIATFTMLPSKPTLLNQQAIQISFVAPSASNKKTENLTHKKVVLNNEQQNAIKQKNNEVEKSESEAKKNQLAGKQTSGREDRNAIATKAAESDPIFNANYLNNPAPFYPLSAKRKGVQGKVMLSVLVKVDGTAAAVNVSRSSGSNDLDQAALAAVKEWKFIPARRGGEVVQASVVVPVEFKII